MFNKEETKAFIVRLGEKWLFPDFTNKLTWYVVTLGAGFILIPQPIKLFFINWMIEIFNVNSGLKLTLPEMEASTDYTTGIILVFMALAHNIGYKYFELKKEIFNHKALQDRRISDYKLLESFLVQFPSNCSSAILLKEHDFGNSFDRDGLQDIDAFYYQWNGAEYHFIDPEIDQKRQHLHEGCKKFLLKVAEYTVPVGASNFSSVIPDHLRADDWNLPEWVTTQIKELNELATSLFNEHQELI
ncbi:MAG: hypothetical protein HN687_02875, partial [Candidatus Marinimicrobia bacterium]|nr:hypothetical protein [Candidatus Neomarinimicrobiota bacterium]